MPRPEPLPSLQSLPAASLVVLEAPPGRAREAHLKDWLGTASGQPHRVWWASADFHAHGPWAGLRDVLSALLPELERSAPELLKRHGYELCSVLPLQRHTLDVRGFSLTDTAKGDERVRHYPPDRAMRAVQGTINLLTTWHARAPQERWVLVLDAFEHASGLGQRFATELLRRRGQALQLTVVLAVAPGTGDDVVALFPASTPLTRVRVDVPEDAPPSPEDAARQAEALEERMKQGPFEQEEYLPAAVHAWKHAQRPERWRKSLALALNLAIHRGTYAEGMRYGAELIGQLEALAQEEPRLHRQALFSLMYGHIAAGEPERALRTLQGLTPEQEAPETRMQLYYNLAMLYSRFLPQPDYDKAEGYLQRALEEIERSSLPESEKHFAHVFNHNGLAFIRMRQRRPQDAIALCRAGFERLEQHLHPERHKLHRSVLVYNISQVYAALGDTEQALAHLTLAMEMDPQYSEYANERGSLWLKAAQPDKALADFRRAIEHSPPYAEVWINLGQCYRLMGRPQQAAQAFSAALDLAPRHLVALRSRASCFDDLGLAAPALEDYSAALALDPAQPGLLANRALLLYAAGKVAESVADLDGAIAQAPRLADLYRNRAIALFDLGRQREAVGDLQTYLQLEPEAEDRHEVEARLKEAARA
ncbi:tetratricopeptide repeat protein [Melittangium boletus]|uniref:tetratricopeptide repeat protein n=1 Tax=Melittangium boletus TaxID=83453 RepID=UPI003DA57B45